MLHLRFQINSDIDAKRHKVQEAKVPPTSIYEPPEQGMQFKCTTTDQDESVGPPFILVLFLLLLLLAPFLLLGFGHMHLS